MGLQIFFLTPSLVSIRNGGLPTSYSHQLLLIRWVTSNHFPLSNLYESLLFLSWSFTSFHLLLQRHSHIPFLGLLTTPLALFTNAFATFSLPPEMQRATGLVPALQSNWLMMYVTIMIVSYAALMSGCLLSMAFLIIQYGESRERRAREATPSVGRGKKETTQDNLESERLPGNICSLSSCIGVSARWYDGSSTGGAASLEKRG